jgi:hypothetical protein
MLAAGPRDVIAPAASHAVAREVLLQAETGRGEPTVPAAPARALTALPARWLTGLLEFMRSIHPPEEDERPGLKLAATEAFIPPTARLRSASGLRQSWFAHAVPVAPDGREEREPRPTRPRAPVRGSAASWGPPRSRLSREFKFGPEAPAIPTNGDKRPRTANILRSPHPGGNHVATRDSRPSGHPTRTTENRGVPGSSPGLAIARNARWLLDFVFSGVLYATLDLGLGSPDLGLAG